MTSGQVGAQATIDRISGVLHDQGVSGTAALVAYPGDGLTVPALFERLATVPVRRVGALAADADEDRRPDSAEDDADTAVPAPRESVEPVELRPLAQTHPDPGARP